MPEKQNTERPSRRRTRERTPARRWLKVLEITAGALLCALLAATPWLYATTERWSVNLMNRGSFLVGAVTVAAWLLRRATRSEEEETSPANPAERWSRWGFLALNLLLLGYCLIAYFNARATFSPRDQSFRYRSSIPWLPTTYDADLTLDTFFSLLACFCAFWSARYWLMRGSERAASLRESAGARSALSNRRFLIIIWVLSLNGMFLAVQGILQRLSNSPKLLWMRMSYWGDSISCFGPFSYRGNAAEYLNLIWPIALGFWWILSRERRRTHSGSRVLTDGPEMMLLPASILMATGTFVSLSRGGFVIAAGVLIAILVILAFQRGVTTGARTAGAAVFIAILAVVTFLGWDQIIARFKDESMNDMSGRTEIYANAKQIAQDFPIFGTGPGSFRSVYHLYRENAQQVWHGVLHDDWLETRVTFGWVGLGLVVLQLLLLVSWVLAAGKPAIHPVFSLCGGLALAGALAHAKFDFPFQTYSILYTFVVIAAILTSVTPDRK